MIDLRTMSREEIARRRARAYDNRTELGRVAHRRRLATIRIISQLNEHAASELPALNETRDH